MNAYAADDRSMSRKGLNERDPAETNEWVRHRGADSLGSNFPLFCIKGPRQFFQKLRYRFSLHGLEQIVWWTAI